MEVTGCFGRSNRRPNCAATSKSTALLMTALLPPKNSEAVLPAN